MPVVAATVLAACNGSPASPTAGVARQGAASARLVVADLRTGATSVLTSGDYSLEALTWSRDGGSIRFVRQRCASCRPRVARVSVARGHAANAVTAPLNGALAGRAAWSANGRLLAVTVQDPEGERTVAVVAGGRVRYLGGVDDADQPALTPDGRRLAYAAEYHETRRIVVERGAGGDRRLYSHGAYSEEQPAWSPDGRALAFSRLQRSMRWDICIVTLATDRVDCLTRTRANERDAAWSPGGGRIAFASDRAGGNTGTRAVYVVGTDATGLRRVSDLQDDSFGPAWSPSGTALAFVTRPAGGG